MKNNRGFTLIEVVVAMSILAIGIITASKMQLSAIRGNHNASYRSSAIQIATSFLEELKRLPFDDNNLSDASDDNAAGLDNGKAEAANGQALPANVDHQFVAVNFPNFAATYQLIGSTIVDNAGHKFTLFWNVDKQLPPWIDPSTETPYCTIRFFVYWDGPTGRNHLEFTTLKYNNIKV